MLATDVVTDFLLQALGPLHDRLRFLAETVSKSSERIANTTAYREALVSESGANRTTGFQTGFRNSGVAGRPTGYCW